MKRIIAASALLCGLFLSQSSADAAFKVRVSDGTHTVTVMDNGAGDADPTPGSLVVTTATLTAGGILGWSAINVTTAFSNKLASDGYAMLEVATGARSNTSGPLTALTVDVTDTDFAAPPSGPSFLMTSTAISTSVPGTETIQGYYDPSNTGNNEFSIPGTAFTPVQTVTSGGVAPTNPTYVFITPGVSPFALDYQEILTPTANGQFFSTDNQLTVTVPAPAGLALAGYGMLTALGYVGLSRRRLLR
jgi:hypothetical protein